MKTNLACAALLILAVLCCPQPNKSFGGIWQDEPKVKVLVPVVDIPAYHWFSDKKKFTVMEIPVKKLREDVKEVISTYEELFGRRSRHYRLRSNEPIYKSDLAEERDSDADDLRYGEVSHAIILHCDRYPQGQFKVGDRLDFSATVNQLTPDDKPKTFVFLEDVELLDTDARAEPHAAQPSLLTYRLLLRLTRPQSLVLKYFTDTAKVDVLRRKKGDPQRLADRFYFSNERTRQQDIPNSTSQKVLDKWLGNWQTSFTIRKSEWVEYEQSGIASIATHRIVDGQFIRENLEGYEHLSSNLTFTYDKEKKSYRAWRFSSSGHTMEFVGIWDADKMTMTWTSVGDQPYSTTIKQRFVDHNNMVWQLATHDKSDRVLYQVDGKSFRIFAVMK